MCHASLILIGACIISSKLLSNLSTCTEDSVFKGLRETTSPLHWQTVTQLKLMKYLWNKVVMIRTLLSSSSCSFGLLFEIISCWKIYFHPGFTFFLAVWNRFSLIVFSSFSRNSSFKMILGLFLVAVFWSKQLFKSLRSDFIL